MRRIAAFVLLLSLLFTLCACRSSTPQSDHDDTAILSDTLREGLEVPELEAIDMILMYPVSKVWTLTNAEGETLHYNGAYQFSGDMEILEQGDPPYSGYPATHLHIQIPVSKSLTIVLDEPTQPNEPGFTIFASTPDNSDSAFYFRIEGTGVSTIMMDTLGVEVRGENMNCSLSAEVYPENWTVALEAESASHMSIFAPRSSSEAILDTDGINTAAHVKKRYPIIDPIVFPMTDGQPLKLTNLQAEDMALIEAVPYED